ncbi:MAG: hypothetical protein KF868_09110 [Acidobacteria bacterium]|nr:hypothetical protein [Acidobacteriota bacterium]MCW5968323.1 hypothetical protein [Blastocatellales bacterium]
MGRIFSVYSVISVCSVFLFLVLSARAEILDRMLATVNGELITESEVRWALALDPELEPLSLSPENRRIMLARLIDQKILGQEAAKIPQNPPTEEEITEYIEELISAFPSREVFQSRLKRVGLDPTSLRDMARRRIELLKYVDFRFRSFVLIQPEEIERYYNEVLIPRLRNRGLTIRSLEEMQTEIEARLSDQRINDELDRFLDEARDAAQIVRLAEI